MENPAFAWGRGAPQVPRLRSNQQQIPTLNILVTNLQVMTTFPTCLWPVEKEMTLQTAMDLRPGGPGAKISPAREGWESDRQDCGALEARHYQHSGCRTSGARMMLWNRCPSPPPDFLWNLVALANFMRLSLLKGARAASSSAAWQEIRVPGWAEVWLPALRAWVRFEVYFRVPPQIRQGWADV